MNDIFFDALTRRASAMTLGTAGAARATSPVDSVAATAKKKAGKIAKRKCKKQAAACSTFFATKVCGDLVECQAFTAMCCEFVGSCDFNGFVDCLLSAQG
jgi:hypothetical protein